VTTHYFSDIGAPFCANSVPVGFWTLSSTSSRHNGGEKVVVFGPFSSLGPRPPVLKNIAPLHLRLHHGEKVFDSIIDGRVK
jgi:hypothetical protein